MPGASRFRVCLTGGQGLGNQPLWGVLVIRRCCANDSAVFLLQTSFRDPLLITHPPHPPHPTPPPHHHHRSAATKSYVDLQHRAARQGADSAPQQRLRPPRFRRLLPFEDLEDTEMCNIIVMEVHGYGGLVDVAERTPTSTVVLGWWLLPGMAADKQRPCAKKQTCSNKPANPSQRINTPPPHTHTPLTNSTATSAPSAKPCKAACSTAAGPATTPPGPSWPWTCRR